ncbi:MAG: ribbon-helix-helix protein, CopG family [Proteobacteria bacterium]|nr:ribbon-helix-helix protein, CopG family [Desulfobacula sp.]MBU4011340.1 ribbon-helix-helix protein, CopG family [Pseudomonadota bacterium]
MRKAIHTRPLTISLTDADYERVRKITDDKNISMAEWFRDAAKMKLEQEEQGVGNND